MGQRGGGRTSRGIVPMAVLVALVVTVLATGCSSVGRTSSGTAAAGSETGVGESAASPPVSVADGPDGEVLDAQAISAPGGASAWRVLYRSHSLAGQPIAVSGMVVVPAGAPPSGGWPVMSWAHGTTGTADSCAPSRDGVQAIPNLDTLLRAGYVLAATDYEGLGTPGPHPYLVGESEGRSVLDAARAARNLVPDATGNVVVWGHSQGGQAAIWAGELASSYAPELPLVGVAAFAPAARLKAMLDGLSTTLLGGFEVAAVAGLAAAHPELHPADVLVPAAVARLGLLEKECMDGVLTAFATIPGGVVVRAALDRPDWQAAMDANEAGQHRAEAPVLVLQGDADVLVLPAASEQYQQAACQTGSSVELRHYESADHDGILYDAPLNDALDWSATRLAGQRVDTTDSC